MFSGSMLDLIFYVLFFSNSNIYYFWKRFYSIKIPLGNTAIIQFGLVSA